MAESMKLRCCAAGCPNRETANRKPNVFYYSFPTESRLLRTRWERAARGKGPDGKWWKATDLSALCSDHFLPDDFDISPGSNTIKLHKKAVPTVFVTQDRTPSSLPEKQCLPKNKFHQMQSGKEQASGNVANSDHSSNKLNELSTANSDHSSNKLNELSTANSVTGVTGKHLPTNVNDFGGRSVYCGALNCYNSRRKCQNLSFFRLPKEHERYKQWVINIGRPDLIKTLDKSVPMRTLTLCEDHFAADQFQCAQDKGSAKKNVYLRWNAVPTLFNRREPPWLKKLSEAHEPPEHLKLSERKINNIAPDSCKNSTQTSPSASMDTTGGSVISGANTQNLSKVLPNNHSSTIATSADDLASNSQEDISFQKAVKQQLQIKQQLLKMSANEDHSYSLQQQNSPSRVTVVTTNNEINLSGLQTAASTNAFFEHSQKQPDSLLAASCSQAKTLAERLLPPLKTPNRTKKLNDLHQKIQSNTTRICKLKKKIAKLQTKQIRAGHLASFQGLLEHISKYVKGGDQFDFVVSQISACQHGNIGAKQHRWTKKDLMFAKELRDQSRKTYLWLSKILRLPSLRTLRRSNNKPGKVVTELALESPSQDVAGGSSSQKECSTSRQQQSVSALEQETNVHSQAPGRNGLTEQEIASFVSGVPESMVEVPVANNITLL